MAGKRGSGVMADRDVYKRQPAAWEGAPRAADQRVAWGEVQQGDGYCREGIKYSRAMPDDIVQMIVQAYFWYPFTNDTI